jgi:hypothetical protein
LSLTEVRAAERLPSIAAPKSERDVVIACYFNSFIDEQIDRGFRWPADSERIRDLTSTVGASSNRLVILHDCLGNITPIENHKIDCPDSPYRFRWRAELEYLANHPEVQYVWLVDSTDVRLLNDPFPHMQPGTLYTGWETVCVGIDYIRRYSASYPDWVEANKARTLLNCGVVGGDRSTVMWLCSRMLELWAELGGEPLEEMVYFNIASYEHPRLVTGQLATTAYKSYATFDPISWWAHK